MASCAVGLSGVEYGDVRVRLTYKNYSGNRIASMVKLHTGEGPRIAVTGGYGMEDLLYAKDIGSGRCGGKP